MTSREIRAGGIRVRNLILKARSAYETRVEENGGLYRPGILEIYLSLYVFIKLQVFPPTNSRWRFTIFFFSPSPFFPSPPVLVIFESIGLPHHLDRCICASLRQFPHRTWPRKFTKTLTSPSFIKYGTLRNLYWTCWLSVLGASCAGNSERSHCSRPIKTSRKLNIMHQILHLPSSPLETLKVYYLISNFSAL